MSDTEQGTIQSADQSVAPATTTEVNSSADQTVDAATTPTETPESETTEVKGAVPSEKDVQVKELIAQRKRRQQAEQEAAYWRGQAEARAQAVSPPAPQQQTPQGPPVLADFETYADWEVAKDAYLLQQAEERVLQRVQQQQQQLLQQQQQQQAHITFQQRLEAAAEEDPTILDIAQDRTLPVSQVMATIIQQSDVAPDLLRHLNAHRKDADRIRLMPPILAAREMGLIEAQLKNKVVAPPPKTVSQAPSPITTVTPAGSVVVDEASLPVDQWIARRNKAQFGY